MKLLVLDHLSGVAHEKLAVAQLVLMFLLGEGLHLQLPSTPLSRVFLSSASKLCAAVPAE